jgi:hypothetical protein
MRSSIGAPVQVAVRAHADELFRKLGIYRLKYVCERSHIFRTFVLYAVDANAQASAYMEKRDLAQLFFSTFDQAHRPLRLINAKPDAHGDWRVEIALPHDARIQLTCLFVHAGQPARLDQALRRRERIGVTGRLAVVAPTWSRPLLARCAASGIDAFDLSGNRVLRSARGARFDRLEQPSRVKPAPPDDYSGRAAAIAIALLREPARIRTQAEIAKQAGVDQSWVSRVVNALADQGIVEVRRSGRRGVRVTSPADVLDTCQRSYSPGLLSNQSPSLRYPGRLDEAERALSAYCEEHRLDHAFTAMSAAARYAATGPYDRVALYLDATPEQRAALLQALELAPARGGNILLWQPAGPVVLSAASKQRDLRVVDPVLAYLDTFTMPGRGRDHARVFRNTALPEDFQ